ncbi:predicted protein [Naegleria gruberi]|uniref:Predicted protein n=1 Tax=Naegleria gruberi TaxID=5762 RepID=D2VN00_NAEGR|nr:uncharacterized protein NAEGRDRAFT_70322 [Naegleria gruberi]EFC41832.1 predicted protein [Naegleria gruberi]|eukprot:XP_002674576.1 predicted protein [Naegleria gruberi strain NEG-M]
MKQQVLLMMIGMFLILSAAIISESYAKISLVSDIKTNPTSPAWPQTLHDEYLSNRVPFNYAHNNWYQTIKVSNMTLFTPKGMIDSFADQMKFILQSQLDNSQFYLSQVDLMSGAIQLSGLKPKNLIPKNLHLPSYFFASGSMVGDKNGNMFMFATNDTLHYGSTYNYLLVVQAKEKTIQAIALSNFGNVMDFYKLGGLLIDEVNNHLIISSSTHLMAVDLETFTIKWKQQLRVFKSQAVAVTGNIISINNNNGNVILFVATVNSIFKIHSQDGLVLAITHLNQPEFENGEAGIGSITSLDGMDLLAVVMNGEASYSSSVYFVNMENQQYSLSMIQESNTRYLAYSCFSPTSFTHQDRSTNGVEMVRVTFACQSSWFSTKNSLVLVSATANVTSDFMGSKFTTPSIDYYSELVSNTNMNHFWIGAASDKRDLISYFDIKTHALIASNIQDKIRQVVHMDLSYAAELWDSSSICHSFTASNDRLYSCCLVKDQLVCRSVQYLN